IFHDPIHGPMELHPLCVSIIDTPHFQRLRNLKQLGACYQVFPGASHNRFEHSLGVCHLAGMLVQSLRTRQPELDISDTDVLCVMVAGLCHDLGHGPLSHMFDGCFIPRIRPGFEWTHEKGSIKMLAHLIEQSQAVKDQLERYEISGTDILFIKEIIDGPQVKRSLDIRFVFSFFSFLHFQGDKGYEGREKEKQFLYEIVANKRNGIDVDKMDYFARDCHHLGIRNPFDHLRYMKFARVLKVEDHREICLRDKEVKSMYDMFYTRLNLHRQAYSHKTNRIIEEMLIEALLAANDHIKFKGKNNKMLKMSEAIDDMEAYSKITDSVFELIKLDQRSGIEGLAKAQEILHKVECRQLYKYIGQTNPIAKNMIDGIKVDKEAIPKIQKDIAEVMTEQELGHPCLSPDSYVVQLVRFDFGMKEKNPINQVNFFTKANPDTPIRISKNEVSFLLPDCFQEVNIRVYCTSSDPDDLKVATECFKKWIEGLKKPQETLHKVECSQSL
ncbi:hypothetical protein CAPTEDRAFT_132479, partial [Capitella teleta]